MTEEILPKSIAQNKMKIGDLEITVHVLDNGQRVIEQSDFWKVMELLGINEKVEE